MLRRHGWILACLAIVGMPSIALTQSNTVPGVDVKLGAVVFAHSPRPHRHLPHGDERPRDVHDGLQHGHRRRALARRHAGQPSLHRLPRRAPSAARGWCRSQLELREARILCFEQQPVLAMPAPSPNGTWLGVGCSDTYSISNNGDSFWLGPPSEIDPWLHMWNPVCSYFDKGDPPWPLPRLRRHPQPHDRNGERHGTGRQSRPRLRRRSELLGSFYYQAQYVIRGEAETTRGDNLGSKRFTPSWNGNFWNITTNDANITYGSILNRWSGATVTSNTNGSDDGRLYVAVKVTGPTGSLYHYRIRDPQPRQQPRRGGLPDGDRALHDDHQRWLPRRRPGCHQ